MSPTIADCLEHARECEWYASGPRTKKTGKSFFGKQRSGLDWSGRRSWKFGRPLG